RRYVGMALWQGRRVLAKLLVGRGAERHFQRELGGARLLAEQGIETPQLLAHGFEAGAGGWLLFAYLENAESLGHRWQRVADQPLLSDAQQQVLADARVLTARVHGQGLCQRGALLYHL